jgi:hypothetical protein
VVASFVGAGGAIAAGQRRDNVLPAGIGVGYQCCRRNGDDRRADQQMLSDNQAFIAMRLFLEQFSARAGNDRETLIADTTLEADGKPLDPAATEDWNRCAAEARRLLPVVE